ncbi:hypothetical protein VQ643_14140 [Pseudomonas sp. F1_0610]|uniref:hypothetical protein n=1 Tax=Pseudomonas sp. F1_0610 TaxID=3114284 RepID=UPI0039C43987
MNKETAIEIINLMLECGDKLNTSVALVESNCSESYFVNYRRVVGHLMGGMLLNIMNPIFKEYPELEPEQLKR